ncbi:hypothetical protein V6N13_046824 [Hibiscus sabdariffa]|uniref:Uncharacterized protein n=2 Tax=Hibiscus sabdariffa TaxID=183260 RepID=A0ABR2B6V9_9ROSI
MCPGSNDAAGKCGCWTSTALHQDQRGVSIFIRCSALVFVFGSRPRTKHRLSPLCFERRARCWLASAKTGRALPFRS